MGAKLTHPPQEVCHQVTEALVVENFRLSKGDLKRFMHWLFKYFPNISWDSVLSRDFWDEVEKKLFKLQVGGDLLVGKFYPLFSVIVKCIDGIGDHSRNVGSQFKSPSPLPSTHVPAPSTQPQGELGDRSVCKVQGCCRLPDASRSPLIPSWGGTSHAIPGSSVSLFPMPSYSVSFPLVNSKDGTRNVARPAILSSLDPSFPTLTPATQNGDNHAFQ